IREIVPRFILRAVLSRNNSLCGTIPAELRLVHAVHPTGRRSFRTRADLDKRRTVMRTVKLLAFVGLLFPAQAGAEILYAHPNADAPGVSYLWGQEVITDSISIKDAVATAKSINGTRPLEIRLLHRAGTEETEYFVDLATRQSAPTWHGSAASTLIIRGQVDRSQAAPRPLTTIVGRSLRSMLCQPAGVELCDPSRRAADEARQDNLDQLATELDVSTSGGARQSAENVRVHYRLPCLFLWDSSFVEFITLGFRDCWVAAVAVYASSNIAL